MHPERRLRRQYALFVVLFRSQALILHVGHRALEEKQEDHNVRRTIIAAFLLGAVHSLSAGVIAQFTSESAWRAVTSGRTDIVFEGISPANGFVGIPVPAGATYSGVNFTINTAQSNGLLFVLGQGFTYPGISVLATQQSTSTNNNIAITLPAAATSVGFVIGTGNPPATLRLSTGDTLTVQTQPFPALAFFGILSDQPIASLQISTGVPVGFDLRSFSFGTAAPEPCSAALIAAGLGFAAARGRGRQPGRSQR